MKQDKGFTLLELIISFSVVTLIGLAAAGMFVMHARMVKISTSKIEKVSELKYCLAEIAANIQSSAWVKIIDQGAIELYSHSSADVRKYSFYKTGSKAGTLEYKKSASSDPIVVARKIDSNEFFKGDGTARNADCFKKIKIEFWEKTAGQSAHLTSDIFYAKIYAYTRESFDTIFVDPVNTSTSETGTKASPYKTLKGAFNAKLLGTDKIFVTGGTHLLSGSVTVPAFLLLAPGVKLDMGKDTSITVRKSFYCAGIPGNLVTFKTMMKNSTWQGLDILSSQKNFDFSYMDISGMVLGIVLKPPSPNTFILSSYIQSVKISHTVTSINKATFDVWYTRTADITNNFFDSNDYDLRAINVDTLTIHHNTSVNNRVHSLSIFSGLYAMPPTPIPADLPVFKTPSPAYHRIYNNSFVLPRSNLQMVTITMGGVFGEFDRMIFNNLFDRVQSAVALFGNPDFRVAYREIIGGNVITGTLTGNGGNSGAIESSLSWTSVPGARGVIIKRNSISGGDRLPYCIALWGGYGIASIANNIITGAVQAGIYVAAINDGASITNNVFSDMAKRNVTPAIAVAHAASNKLKNVISISNNIFYSNQGMLIRASSPWRSSPRTTIGYEQNTIVYGHMVYRGWSWPSSNGISQQYRNSIAWGSADVPAGFQQYISYSDVKNMAPNPSKAIISKNPLFVDAPKNDYRLMEGSPCIGTGFGGYDMGAYGGEGAAEWADGVGPEGPIGNV